MIDQIQPLAHAVEMPQIKGLQKAKAPRRQGDTIKQAQKKASTTTRRKRVPRTVIKNLIKLLL